MTENVDTGETLSDVALMLMYVLHEHDGRFYTFDAEMCELVTRKRQDIYSAKMAWWLNLWGPSQKRLLTALKELETGGYMSQRLETVEEADGHGMVNWSHPENAPRGRHYLLTEKGDNVTLPHFRKALPAHAPTPEPASGDTGELHAVQTP